MKFQPVNHPLTGSSSKIITVYFYHDDGLKKQKAVNHNVQAEHIEQG